MKMPHRILNFSRRLDADTLLRLPTKVSQDQMAWYLAEVLGASKTVATPTPHRRLRHPNRLAPLLEHRCPDVQAWAAELMADLEFTPLERWPRSLEPYMALTSPQALLLALQELRAHPRSLSTCYAFLGATGLVAAGCPLTLHPDFERDAADELATALEVGPLLAHFLRVDTRLFTFEDPFTREALELRAHPLRATRKAWMNLSGPFRNPDTLMRMPRRPDGK
jgi:hypothetical protein